jgi:hypothetical protein
LAYSFFPPAALQSVPVGAVAQLGERGVRNAEVRGSIPLRSTRLLSDKFGTVIKIDNDLNCGAISYSD